MPNLPHLPHMPHHDVHGDKSKVEHDAKGEKTFEEDGASDSDDDGKEFGFYPFFFFLSILS